MKLASALLGAAMLAAHAHAQAPTPAPTTSVTPAPTTPAPALKVCSSAAIAPIYTISQNRTECTYDSGYWFVPPARPTDKDVAAICGSAACKHVFTTALEKYPEECLVNIGGTPIQYRKDLLDRVNGVCKFFTPTPAPTPAPTTVAPPPPKCAANVTNPIYKISADRTQCTTDSGYWFTPPASPTDKDLPKICASEACKRVFSPSIIASPSECYVDFGTSKILLRKELLDRVNTACKFVVPPTPAPTTVAPSPTPATPPPPCVASNIAPIYTISLNRTECTYDSGYWFVPPARPTDKEVAAICGSAACKQVFSTALAAKPADCTVTFGGAPIQYRKDLLDRVNGVCKFY